MVTGGEWTSSTISWDNMPAANTLLEENISHNNLTKYQFSCLTAVQHWYDGDPTGQNENYGVMIRYYDETIADYNSVFSADYTVATQRPTMTISYDPQKRLFDEGDTFILSAPDTAGEITWASSNTSVATVTSTGQTTGVKAGVATVTATVGGTVVAEYTIYVRVANGIYRIQCANSAFYLGMSGGIQENIQARIVDYATDSILQSCQLWKVTHLGDEYYSVRPMCAPNMALHYENGIVDFITVGTANTMDTLPSACLWTISYDTNGYVFQCGGNTSQTMRVSSIYPSAKVFASEYVSTNANYKWNFALASGVTTEVLLFDSQTGKPAKNTARCLTVGDTVSLTGLGIAATFMCNYFANQTITWSTSDSDAVAVNSATGTVTALTSGKTVTISAEHIHNGVKYAACYTVYVAKANELTYRVVHYYDYGYNIRENGAYSAIQSYHNAVAAKFRTVFGVNVVATIEPYYSICDQCKKDQFGTVLSNNLDASCSHSPKCLNTDSVRNNLFANVSEGNEIASVVIWSGHRMLDYEDDRSNSRSSNHSVVITTYGIEEAVDKYAERTHTLFHELSHQLGAPDHYCYGAAPGQKCLNTSCDKCYNGYNNPRACVMSYRYDISTLSDDEIYCNDCKAIIRNHLQDHH